MTPQARRVPSYRQVGPVPVPPAGVASPQSVGPRQVSAAVWQTNSGAGGNPLALHEPPAAPSTVATQAKPAPQSALVAQKAGTPSSQP